MCRTLTPPAALQAIYESKKHIYIVLEYCAAGTLEDMLSLRRKLTEEESR